MTMFLPIFQWVDDSTLGVVVRNSIWLFPFIEAFHLLGLAVLGGAVLVVNFRLLGLGLTDVPVARIARDVFPWMVGSLVVLLVSGYLLFASEAMKCYPNLPFWIKIGSLMLAILFTFTVHRWFTLADDDRFSPGTRKLVALLSIGLWSLVGLGGRAIGFY